MEKQDLKAGEVEFQFYNQLDPETINKKKPRQELRKMISNQTQDQTEKKQKHFRVTINKTVINYQIYIALKINQTKTKIQIFYKKLEYLI